MGQPVIMPWVSAATRTGRKGYFLLTPIALFIPFHITISSKILLLDALPEPQRPPPAGRISRHRAAFTFPSCDSQARLGRNGHRVGCGRAENISRLYQKLLIWT